MARESEDRKSKPATDVTPRDTVRRDTPSTKVPETPRGGSVLPAPTQRAYGGGVEMGGVIESVIGGGLDKGAVQSRRLTPSGAIRLGEAPVAGSGLTADPNYRISLSDPSVRSEHAESKAKLEALKNKLDEFRGQDEESRPGENTEPVPMSEEELQQLRSAVQSAIDLHNASLLSPHLIDALKNIYEFLREWLVKLTVVGASAAGAFEALEWAVEALKEFLVALRAL